MRQQILRGMAATAAAVAAAGLLASASTPARALQAVSQAAVSQTAVSRTAVSQRAGPALVPVLRWRACDDGFQCATARVPLDYRHPRGAAISIAVVRHRATDPAHRLGTMFYNGGGPNAQIQSFVAGFSQGVPPVLAQDYDWVTFDPRGFGASTPVRCFPTEAAENSLVGALPQFPVGAAQDAAWESAWGRFDAQCARRGGPLLDHDTTADVARDMDLLRQAVGDPVLNFVGESYGTLLGATYANLFPARVGHMALDGNVDPAAWTRSGPLPSWLRLSRDQGSAQGMRDFLDLCGQATTAQCAFSAGTPAATRAKWTTLLRRLRAHPVTLGSPAQEYTYAYAVASVPLGDVTAWPAEATLLQQLWLASAAATTRAAARGTAAAGYSGQEQQLAVVCSDGPNPRDPGAYPGLARRAYARSGGFGTEFTWQSEQCAQWPAAAGQDRYTGPWNRRTAATILLIGNTGDPTTPYQGSVALSRELARARLLTVDGYGHTEQANPSTCALDDEVRYLLTGTLPPAGTICPQDAPPFPASPGA
jgi:pimeloyl-ACP methyl ester carboxylesterase